MFALIFQYFSSRDSAPLLGWLAFSSCWRQQERCQESREPNLEGVCMYVRKGRSCNLSCSWCCRDGVRIRSVAHVTWPANRVSPNHCIKRLAYGRPLISNVRQPLSMVAWLPAIILLSPAVGRRTAIHNIWDEHPVLPTKQLLKLPQSDTVCQVGCRTLTTQLLGMINDTKITQRLISR